MKTKTNLIAIAGGSSKADGIPRPLAGVAFIQDNRLHVETSTVLLHVKLRRCVIVLTLPNAAPLEIRSHVQPSADPMPVRCSVQLKHGDVRSIVRELAPLPLTELISGLELRPGEILAFSFELSVKPATALVGFTAEVIR
jgi:DNA-binding helix-hairpin-helix protein with protein kinase domain